MLLVLLLLPGSFLEIRGKAELHGTTEAEQLSATSTRDRINKKSWQRAQDKIIL